MRIPRPAQRGPILFEHRVQHLQARTDHQLEQLGLRIDQQIDERQRWRGDSTAAGRDGLCETSSWRLLVGGLSPGLVTTRVSRAVRSRRFKFQQLVGHPRWRERWLQFTGHRECRANRADVPEAGVAAYKCFLQLADVQTEIRWQLTTSRRRARRLANYLILWLRPAFPARCGCGKSDSSHRTG